MAIYASSRVIRTAQDQHFRLFCQRLSQLVRGEAIAVFILCLYRHHLSSGYLHHLGITHPTRHRNHHLVSRINHRLNGIVYRHLRPHTHNHIGSLKFAIFNLQSAIRILRCRNGFAQRCDSRYRPIMRPSLVYRFLRRTTNVFRCLHIRFTQRHTDHINPCSLHRLCPRRHRQTL